ncbi:hypothetical protein IO90_16605 [Chryseobacterium sp. FH1]|nr:hypothetical protein IO90_16605 [Chryseobacterium sp. FH1]
MIRFEKCKGNLDQFEETEIATFMKFFWFLGSNYFSELITEIYDLLKNKVDLYQNVSNFKCFLNQKYHGIVYFPKSKSIVLD